MKSFVIAFLAVFIYASGWCQPVFKKMFGQFSPNNFELNEISFTNNFILSNHNVVNGRHTFFKLDETGEPFDQNYIYQPIGGSTTGSHKYYFRNDSVFDLIGLHATPGSYPAVAFISRQDSSLQNVILSRFYEYRPSAPGVVSCMNLDSSYSIGGGYAVVPGQYYPMMFKLDTGLNVSWSQSYRDRVGYVQDLVQAPDGGYYLLMHLINESMALAKTDTSGNILWCNNYTAPFRKAQRMLLLSDSSLLLLSYKNDPNNSTQINPVLTKVDLDGNVLWSMSYGDVSNEFVFWAGNPILSMDTAINGRIVLCGSLVPQWHYYADMILMTLDSSGLPIWSRSYGNDFYSELASICHQTSDGGFIVGGFNNYQINNFPPVFNQANITVIKTDSIGVSDGCMEYPVTIYSEPDTPLVTSLTWSIYVDNIVTEIPSNMVDTTGTPTRNESMCTFVSLMEQEAMNNQITVFPNPSDGVFTFQSGRKIEMISVTDITGRLLSQITSTVNPQTEINLCGQPPGIYLATVYTEKGVETVKLVLR